MPRCRQPARRESSTLLPRQPPAAQSPRALHRLLLLLLPHRLEAALGIRLHGLSIALQLHHLAASLCRTQTICCALQRVTLTDNLHVCCNQNDLFAHPEVELPPPTSNQDFNRALYERGKSQKFVRPSADWGGETRAERCEVLRSLYAEVLAEEKPVIQALGTADVLREADAWDAPPLESWKSIEKLIAEGQERGDELMDKEQLEAMAREHDVARARTGGGVREGKGRKGEGTRQSYYRRVKERCTCMTLCSRDWNCLWWSPCCRAAFRFALASVRFAFTSWSSVRRFRVGVVRLCEGEAAGSGELRYIVERILRCRTRRGQQEREFFVKWRGYPGEETWEWQSLLYPLRRCARAGPRVLPDQEGEEAPPVGR